MGNSLSHEIQRLMDAWWAFWVAWLVSLPEWLRWIWMGRFRKFQRQYREHAATVYTLEEWLEEGDENHAE
jgi:hypothetical protein